VKRLLIKIHSVFFAAVLLASCAAPQLRQEPPGDVMLEQQSPQNLPDALSPPAIANSGVALLRSPYLVRLEPYIDGSYTDGMNTFIFLDDGTILANLTFSNPRVQLLGEKEIDRPKPRQEIMETDEFRRLSELASFHLGYSYDLMLNLVHMDGGDYYLSLMPVGGGSGESFYHADEALLVRISSDGDFLDYGQIRAVHAVVYGGHIYYMELTDRILWTAGTGRIIRMDTDGANKTTVVDEIVYGTFHIANDKLYYSGLADGRAYSVSLDGMDKTPVGSRIAPDNHRVRLDFYGELIISKYWISPGYSVGNSTFPSEISSPAIMDRFGNDLLTFPAELRGEDAYEIVNWGGEEAFYDAGGYSGNYYLFLKSKLDGSYWVYSKWYSQMGYLYYIAREQYAAMGEIPD